MAKVKHIRQFTIGPLVPVDRFDRSKHYVMVVDSNREYNGIRCREGFNAVPNNYQQDSGAGKIHFTTLEHLPYFYNRGAYIAELVVPEYTNLILTSNNDEYEVDRINILKFWNLNDFLAYVGYIEINFYADFSTLETAKGLENLKTIKGTAFFDRLISAEGLENLESIESGAHFNNLVSAKGLRSLETIGLDAVFPQLKTAEGLENLQSIGGDAYFNSLKKEKVAHIKVGGSLYTQEVRQ